MKTFKILTLVAVIATLLTCASTTPSGRVSTANLALQDGVTGTQKVIAGIAFEMANQDIDNYILFKVATVRIFDTELRLVGLPFFGKYYKLESTKR